MEPNEPYYHRFCTLGDKLGDSCGQHDNCHSMWLLNACPECDKEAKIVKEGLPIDIYRKTRDEIEQIFGVKPKIEAEEEKDSLKPNKK